MTERLLLGVDGGGTSCRVRICNAAGGLLGEGRAGPANVRLGLERVFATISEASRQALDAAGMDRDCLGRMHAALGLAGVNLRSERDKVLAHPHPFASMQLTTDLHIACLGTHGGADGGVVVVGTGSSALGLVGGQLVSIGGWGFEVGDQGSGAAIGREAVRRALLAHDRIITETPFSRAVRERFEHDPENLVVWAESALPRDFASLAPLAFEHATEGDAIALDIVAEAARDATRLIRGLIGRGVDRVCLMGGLATLMRPLVAEELSRHLVAPRGDALHGAVLLARRQAGEAGR